VYTPNFLLALHCRTDVEEATPKMRACMPVVCPFPKGKKKLNSIDTIDEIET